MFFFKVVYGNPETPNIEPGQNKDLGLGGQTPLQQCAGFAVFCKLWLLSWHCCLLKGYAKLEARAKRCGVLIAKPNR